MTRTGSPGGTARLVAESSRRALSGPVSKRPLSSGASSRRGIAALDAGSGLATSWDPSADNTVYALALGGGLLHAGGDFTQIDGAQRTRLAALDVATRGVDAWAPGADAYVL